MPQSVSAADDITRVGSKDSQASPPREPGVLSALLAAYGRYAVIALLGRGGMGKVVRAYDPKLQREVALERLHSHGAGPEGTARLVREAQAMAQLSHPNVVAIYDVELESEAVVLAMEYVGGGSLLDWVTHERPWREILDALIQAGRGLAAGIVHRDFKPRNVSVDDDDATDVE